MHDEFLNQRHGTFFFIAILDGIFFALMVQIHLIFEINTYLCKNCSRYNLFFDVNLKFS
jgi:hypothetical protein